MNASRGGAGIVLWDPYGWIWEHVVRLEFSTTNNESEYKALLFGLCLAIELQAEHMEVFTDSQLVAGQVDGSFEARELNMAQYLTEARRLISMTK
ncbi:hypothetical protein BHE74_00005949 [Ensete ventricosum]|nr:hypothetical protein BHE74_00005949 [Ensete ventricosum]